jgi:hypothetical protein
MCAFIWSTNIVIKCTISCVCNNVAFSSLETLQKHKLLSSLFPHKVASVPVVTFPTVVTSNTDGHWLLLANEGTGIVFLLPADIPYLVTCICICVCVCVCVCVYIYIYKGHEVSQLVEAPRYKPEGRGFNSRWCQWTLPLKWSFRSHYGPEVDSASNRYEYQRYFPGVKAAGA